MKTTNFLGFSCLLASLAAAVPLARRELVVVTVTDYTTLTIGMTTTIYVDPALSPAPTTSSPPSTTPSTSSSSSSSTSEPPRAPSPYDAAQFYVPPTTAAEAAPASTPTQAPAPVQQAYQPPPPPAAEPTPTPTPPSPPPSSSSTTDYGSSMNGVSPVTGGSALAGGSCTPGSPCSGDMTYYDVGLGACGTTNDGDKEYVVALPHGMMGTLSNNNPFCGKTVNIKYGEKVIKAKAVDKCMGCKGTDLDLSNLAFKALADMGIGRTTCTWWFD